MLHSIPPHMRNQQRVRTESTMRRTFGTHRNGNDFKPTIVRRGRTPTRRTTTPPIILTFWPERAEPEVIGFENRVWVIVQFPRHTIEQIEWSNDDDLLTIKSSISSCSYINKIALPKNRGKRINVV